MGPSAAGGKHTTAPINHNRPLACKHYYNNCLFYYHNRLHYLQL